MMMNGFAWWWIFPLGGVILGVLGVILVFRTGKRLPQRSVESPHGPLAVARERYARGKISKPEFEQLVQDLLHTDPNEP